MSDLTVGSLFAGVGGFDIAAERAGMTVKWQSEVDKAASNVLEYHWPGLNKGDIHGVESTDGVDVLVGGFPCQSYSVAGGRGGLLEDRGALWWEYHRLIAEGRPKWVVGENVPGLLSSGGGRDFAQIIQSIADLGYTVGWRVLDSQYFGVAQRRRRVFIVAVRDLGIGSPAEVLALAQGMQGDPKPSRQTQQTTSPEAGSDAASGFGLQAELIGRNPDAGPNGAGVAPFETDPGYTLNVAGGVQAVAFNANQDPTPHDEQSPTLVSGGHSANDIGVVTARMTAFGEYADDDLASTIKARDYKDATDLVAFTQNQRDEVRDPNNLAGALAAEPGMKQQTYIMRQREGKPGGGKGPLLQEDISMTLAASGNDQTLFNQAVVRRLTPLECERLQGFPDNWTDIPGNSQSQRYKQMGNAVTVNTIEWLMKRIAAQ